MYFFEVCPGAEYRVADGVFTSFSKAQDAAKEYCRLNHLGDGHQIAWNRNQAGTQWWIEQNGILIVITKKLVDTWTEHESLDEDW